MSGAPASPVDAVPGSGSKMPRSVLFMCGQNAIRSPMAETLARSMLPKGTYVASAGVRSGERDPFVDVVLSEIGLTIGRHQPHTLDELEDDYFDLIITLAPEAHHAALELTRSNAVEVVYWPTPDPTVATGTREQIVSAYRDVRNHLAMMLERRLVPLASEMPQA
ncbi:arsenate-mycothiol transferase ArsC [Pararhizobium sp.]|uniref:arsenate-mycothiol transferase ArsC n=1 Tax=Pararhizobium sp. TaxID=1977563 RepID=UPI00271CEEDC|nr:low molecular weight phosphatase family protein [Pararhizobium sp.]MDO9416231.1 low molecular weight phosphatase family protein [Pararhizobium sp.]